MRLRLASLPSRVTTQRGQCEGPRVRPAPPRSGCDTRALGRRFPSSLNGDLKRTELAYAEAAVYYQQAVEVMESVPTARQELAEYLNAWGLVSHEAGEYAKAGPLYRRALGIREQALGPTHPGVAQSLNNLAALYQAQGRYAAAEPLYQRALASRERVLGTDHPDIAMTSTTSPRSTASRAAMPRTSRSINGPWRYASRPWVPTTPISP